MTRTLRGSTALILALVAARLALPLLLIHPAWEFHRDELLYFAMGDHLAWRMQFPPFIATVAALSTALFGDAVWAARVPAAIGGAALTATALWFVRRLGGGVWALCLTWLALLAAPVFLRPSVLFQPVVFDQLWATLALAAVALAAMEQEPRWWLLAGVALGFGLLTKLSVLMYGAVIFGLSLVHAPLRAQLRTRWPWLAAAAAATLGLPTLLGQLHYDWPFLQSLAALREGQFEHTSVLGTVGEQGMMLGASVLLAAAAALLGLRSRWRSVMLPLLLFWGGLLGLVLWQGGKAYYAAPAYPLLLGVGSLIVAEWQGRGLRLAMVVVLVAGGVALAPMGIPLLAPEAMAVYSARLGAGTTTNRGEALSLPQDYADMLGWRAQAEAMRAVYAALSPEDRAEVVILGGNYGQAGALARYAPRFAYPYPVSTAGDFHAWGPGSRSGALMLVLGEPDAERDLQALYERVVAVDSLGDPRGVPEERDLRIFLVRGPRVPLPEAWKQVGPNWR